LDEEATSSNQEASETFHKEASGSFHFLIPSNQEATSGSFHFLKLEKLELCCRFAALSEALLDDFEDSQEISLSGSEDAGSEDDNDDERGSTLRV